MWTETVKIYWNDMFLGVEVLLEENDLTYGQDADGNRAQDQKSIKIIEINTITKNEQEYTFDDFSIRFINSLNQYDELMRILEEEVNRGELC